MEHLHLEPGNKPGLQLTNARDLCNEKNRKILSLEMDECLEHQKNISELRHTSSA
jgi:hypothetical protein